MDFYTDVDDASAALILQLQIQDAAELFQANNEQAGLQEENDSQIALNSYRKELQRNYSIITDRIMTKSIAQACRSDGNQLFNLVSEEQVAESDDDFEDVNTPDQAYQQVDYSEWESMWEPVRNGHRENMKQVHLNSSTSMASENTITNRNSKEARYPSSSGSNNQPESSRWAAIEKAIEIEYGNCIACSDMFPSNELAKCTCDHQYCRACLSDLFNASITDDGLFPPRCCKQPIIMEDIQNFLSAELIQRFEAKKIELETLDKTYCSNQVCSAFISFQNISEDRAECPECSAETCVMCKSTWHTGDCPADTDLQNVLELAKDNGWQRCFNCRRVIELEVGCNHMTCLCGTEFCYVCAERWKTCSCPQWDEGLLLARANIVVGRQPINVDLQEQEEQIAAAVENLRLRHNCLHEDWRWVRGRHNCEECFHTLPSYIFECRQCSIRACNRCRRSRL